MLDTLTSLFGAVTYILIIIAGIHNRSAKQISMPYVAGALNFGWEICALYTSHGYWGHFLWLVLDIIIVYFGFCFLSFMKKKNILRLYVNYHNYFTICYI